MKKIKNKKVGEWWEEVDNNIMHLGNSNDSKQNKRKKKKQKNFIQI